MSDAGPFRRIVICGEVNPYGKDPKFALYHLPRNASGNKLREHLGLPDHVYARLRKVNLCTGTWLITKAMETVMRERVTADLRVVVMLGAKVRRAFWRSFDDPSPPEWFSATKLGDRSYVYLPHPSGLNHLWNARDARERARRVMVSVAPEVNWGELEST